MEGYGNRYTAVFKDKYDATINVIIMKKGYSGVVSTLVLAGGNPVIISKPQGDLLTHIFGTGCKITIVNTGDLLQYTEMFGTPEREHYVKVTKTVGATVTILFEGYVVPQLYEQDLKHKAYITIPANDFLSSLKFRKSDLLSSSSNNYINIMDLIKDILWSTGLKLPIYVKNGIYNKHYTEEFDDTITPFDESYFDRNLYLDNSGEPEDSFKVLESVLKSFGSRLYYDNGRWFVDRVKNIKNLTDYKVYEYDTSTGVATIEHPVVELTDHKIFAPGGSMMYVGGTKEYDLTLNLNMFGNYVQNDFSGISDTENKVVYNFPDATRLFIVPQTTKYNWVTNDKDNRFNIFNKNYSDQNIQQGIDWGAKLWESGYLGTNYASITTRISVDYSTESNLNIKGKVTLTKDVLEGRSIRFKYALRYLVDDTPTYHYIFRKTENDEIVLDSNVLDFNNPIFLFSEYIDGNEILEGKTPTLFEINENLDIGSIMEKIKGQISPTKPLYFVEFFLDIFQIESKTGKPNTSGTWNPVRTRIGDLNVKSTSKLENNIINAMIEEDYNTKMDLSLDLFDYPSITVKNPVLVKDGEIYKIPPRWNEVDYEYAKTLQLIYLTDLIQNYSKNRYRINSILRMDNTLPHLGSIYTIEHIEKDSEPVEMICMGYDHNLQESSFNLFLQEWTDYDDYELLDEIQSGGPAHIEVSPSQLNFHFMGGWDSFDVSSNIQWYASVDDPSVYLTKVEGTGNDNVSVYLPARTPGIEATIQVNNFNETIIRTIGVYQETLP